ncbi:lipopolysaccharide heptosyltransferase II [secondary endosymbiont of Heteropsylla cubana]|uniref:lipopolysaccharide heptosyltransferase II n=2 Tax=secondary endosymbiont of Heteropsylla cubana TaxID=134287 RepID=J3VTT7_9ENTR|nr:lipopolysaccharide heptosyltransferase II [secondary endosymbiont of Heteropsylla cubana]
MMMSQSLYRYLVQYYDTVKIDVMAPKWSLPLLKHMPEINQIFEIPLNHGTLALDKRYRLGKSLRKETYQQAIVLPNSFKSAIIPFFANIPQRTAWRGEMRYGIINDLRKLDKKAFPLMVQRYAALAFENKKIRDASELPNPLLWPRIMVSNEDKELALKTFFLKNPYPLIGFCPGAEFSLAKCWPDYHYATLAKKLIHCGYQIALFGSIKNRATGKEIRFSLTEDIQKYCHNLMGTTSLEEVISLIAACHAVVSNDSGLMHIASALSRPLVALYGPTSPNFTPPLSHQARVIRPVRGYHKIRQGNKKKDYHQSLIAIKPDQVFRTLSSLLVS